MLDRCDGSFFEDVAPITMERPNSYPEAHAHGMSEKCTIAELGFHRLVYAA